MRDATPMRPETGQAEPEPGSSPKPGPAAPETPAPPPRIRAKPPPLPTPQPRVAPKPGKPGAAQPKAIKAPSATGLPEPVGRPEPGLDRNTAKKLSRGDRAPDARLDLHGLTADRAHAKLDAFIAQAIGAGHRCVLVITGKGGRHAEADQAPWMRRRHGVLREEAPRWLTTGRFARHVVGIYQAHARHGGGGAFYVYLKKSRTG